MVLGLMHATAMLPGGPPPPGFSGGLAAPSLPASRGTPETEALLKRLLALADSQNDTDHRELVRQLSDPVIIDRLDEPKERNQRSPQDLRLARIFERLGSNPSPLGADTLAALSRSDALNADWRLQELVIRAFAPQRPLRADSVAFLDAQSQPKALNLQVVIHVLIENESEPALELLGRKFADAAIDDTNKLSWIRRQLFPKRRAPGLLDAAERWLSNPKFALSLRTALVDVLFDYRPREWGGPDLLPPPLPETATSPESTKILHRIGKHVLASHDYPASVKNAVRQTLAKLP
jgi:hypothetical protein